MLTLHINLDANLTAFLRTGFAVWASPNKQKIVIGEKPKKSFSTFNTPIVSEKKQQIVHALTNMILHNQQLEIR